MNSQRELEPPRVCEGLGWISLSVARFILLDYGSDSVAGRPGHM